jgi:hypothetical protein
MLVPVGDNRENGKKYHSLQKRKRNMQKVIVTLQIDVFLISKIKKIRMNKLPL